MSAGADRRHLPESAIMTSSYSDDFADDREPIIGPIAGLAEGLPKAALESLVAEATLRYRYLRDIAERRYQQLSQQPAGDGPVGFDRVAYVEAMIAVHGQQAILSTLLDVLGYVPELAPD